MSGPGSLVYFLLEIVPFNEHTNSPQNDFRGFCFKKPVFFSNSLKLGPLKNVEVDAVISHVMPFFHFVNNICKKFQSQESGLLSHTLQIV